MLRKKRILFFFIEVIPKCGSEFITGELVQHYPTVFWNSFHPPLPRGNGGLCRYVSRPRKRFSHF